MRTFQRWLTESKGIRVTDEIDQKIDAILPQLHKLAVQVKQTGEDEFVEHPIDYIDQYFKDRPRHVYIQIVNDPDGEYHGDFNPISGVRINVAHTEPKAITPRWVRRILVHELGIHSQDPKLSDLNTFTKRNVRYQPWGDAGHYTQDIEFDAYSGQIVDSLIKAAKMSKGGPQAGAISKMVDDTLTFIQNPVQASANKVYGLIADPDYWKSFNIYYQQSSPDQKRRLYQRIYKAAMDAKAILAQ